MIRTFESLESALAISTICFFATDKLAIDALGSVLLSPTFASSDLVSTIIAFLSSRPPARTSSLPRKMFSYTVRSGIRFSSWWIMEMPISLAAVGPAMTTGFPWNTTLPSVGCAKPARMFMSVLLPAPFSPMIP